MIYIEDKILEFINRRFQVDCNWTDGNCYFFSVILKSVFNSGKIFYDVINGHFVFLYDGKYYDWTGVVIPDGYLVEWEKFDEYDTIQKHVVIRDCII